MRAIHKAVILLLLVVTTNLILVGVIRWRIAQTRDSFRRKLANDMMVWVDRFDTIKPPESDDEVPTLIAERNLRLMLRLFVEWFRDIQRRQGLIRTPKDVDIDQVILKDGGVILSRSCETPFYGMFFVLSHKICDQWGVAIVADILNDELRKSEHSETALQSSLQS